MKLLTFKGGIHPPYRKEYTSGKPLEIANQPKVVYIPMQQHIGAPAKPIVQVGELVKVGQKIGEMQGFVSANVHSSISGKVTITGNCHIMNDSYIRAVHQAEIFIEDEVIISNSNLYTYLNNDINLYLVPIKSISRF